MDEFDRGATWSDLSPFDGWNELGANFVEYPDGTTYYPSTGKTEYSQEALEGQRIKQEIHTSATMDMLRGFKEIRDKNPSLSAAQLDDLYKSKMEDIVDHRYGEMSKEATDFMRQAGQYRISMFEKGMNADEKRARSQSSALYNQNLKDATQLAADNPEDVKMLVDAMMNGARGIKGSDGKTAGKMGSKAERQIYGAAVDSLIRKNPFQAEQFVAENNLNNIFSLGEMSRTSRLIENGKSVMNKAFDSKVKDIEASILDGRFMDVEERMKELPPVPNREVVGMELPALYDAMDRYRGASITEMKAGIQKEPNTKIASGLARNIDRITNDPWSYADISRSLGDVPEISISSPESIQRRAEYADRLSAQLETDVPLFRKNEMKTIVQGAQSGKLGVIQNLLHSISSLDSVTRDRVEQTLIKNEESYTGALAVAVNVGLRSPSDAKAIIESLVTPEFKKMKDAPSHPPIYEGDPAYNKAIDHAAYALILAGNNEEDAYKIAANIQSVQEHSTGTWDNVMNFFGIGEYEVPMPTPDTTAEMYNKTVTRLMTEHTLLEKYANYTNDTLVDSSGAFIDLAEESDVQLFPLTKGIYGVRIDGKVVMARDGKESDVFAIDMARAIRDIYHVE